MRVDELMVYSRKTPQDISDLLNGESVSVVIPAYNREKTIKDTVDSVLRQTYLPNEIIVVDDGSTDNTRDVVQEIAENCSSVKIIYCDQKNAGAQKARNKGIELAAGEWIAFLDSDDLWVSDKLEQQAKAIQKVNYDKNTVVHGDCTVRNVENGETTLWNLPLTEGENVYCQLLERPSPTFPTLFTSKKALMEAGMLDEKVPSYQEWDTSIRLSQKCRFIHINKPLFEYRVHNTVFRNPKRDFEGYFYIVNKYKDEIINRCGWDVWNNHIELLIKKSLTIENYDMCNRLVEYIPDSFGTYKHFLKLFVLTRGKLDIILRGYYIYQKYGVSGIVRKIFSKV